MTTITGILEVSSSVLGTLISSQAIVGVLSEEGDTMPDDSNIITMSLRNDRTLECVVTYASTGLPVDLTGSYIWLTAKNKSSDLDAAAIIQKMSTLAGGDDTEIKIDTPMTNGSFEVYLIPADTTLVDAGSYMYDIRITLASGKTYTIVNSQMVLKGDVTRTV